MKRIAFDLRCLPADGSAGAGIAHAARELFCACIEEASHFDLECVGYVMGDAEASGSGTVRRLASSSSRSSLWKAVREDGCDAVFAPTGSVSIGCPLPSFVWVHDVEIFSHPEWFPQSRFQRYFTTHVFLQSLRRARHVFCVSEDTRNNVLRLIPSLDKRVSVTREGVETPVVIKTLDERCDQVLIMGTVEPRKNISFISNVWPEVCRRVKRPVKLIIAGKDGWGKVEIPAEEHLLRFRDVSDAERDRLIGESRLVLVPSWHEGFGRVALEGMAHGTPVIASDRGAHPEVVGDGGILLDPTDREGWIEAITRLLMNQEDWRQMQEKGRARAQSFSWKEVAEGMLAVIAKSC
ncbi:glycosyltransferase family 4 protein [Patescibacteria group bacterium]|nr:glycosyltransferase family 4 protein [Patescibacteria group bacterium]MBP9709926.1 glycosyltransferase family 4 protein [Patescibacteria group bacterium]